GDQKKSKTFLDEFETYRFINRRNISMKIPADRVALALSFIKGDHVKDWARQQMQELVHRTTNTINPILETNEYLWSKFERDFRTTFTDTAEEEDALQKLYALKMEKGNLDLYAAEFWCLM